ncbi:LuxR C-terminal-related transcriptional regulator [Nocardia sp. NBC_01730]|uniref:LuxR C-terminal-related transcriptional regulator n=1 Tax=Nocardia sp. NBC_01730 TaxID=2975998 RepID=UPI002E12144A|nr:LuxR C-terminal-related transcriptional regulator [Nocardia sp. NBC_01730]
MDRSAAEARQGLDGGVGVRDTSAFVSHGALAEKFASAGVEYRRPGAGEAPSTGGEVPVLGGVEQLHYGREVLGLEGIFPVTGDGVALGKVGLGTQAWAEAAGGDWHPGSGHRQGLESLDAAAGRVRDSGGVFLGLVEGAGSVRSVTYFSHPDRRGVVVVREWNGEKAFEYLYERGQEQPVGDRVYGIFYGADGCAVRPLGLGEKPLGKAGVEHPYARKTGPSPQAAGSARPSKTVRIELGEQDAPAPHRRAGVGGPRGDGSSGSPTGNGVAGTGLPKGADPMPAAVDRGSVDMGRLLRSWAQHPVATTWRGENTSVVFCPDFPAPGATAGEHSSAAGQLFDQGFRAGADTGGLVYTLESLSAAIQFGTERIYVIDAPGGFRQHGASVDGHTLIVFPGGIHPAFIVGYLQLDPESPDQPFFVVNPGYNPRRSPLADTTTDTGGEPTDNQLPLAARAASKAAMGEPCVAEESGVVTLQSKKTGRRLFRSSMGDMNPDKFPEGPQRHRAAQFIDEISRVPGGANYAGRYDEYSDLHIARLEKLRDEFLLHIAELEELGDTFLVPTHRADDTSEPVDQDVSPENTPTDTAAHRVEAGAHRAGANTLELTDDSTTAAAERHQPLAVPGHTRAQANPGGNSAQPTPATDGALNSRGGSRRRRRRQPVKGPMAHNRGAALNLPPQRMRAAMAGVGYMPGQPQPGVEFFMNSQLPGDFRVSAATAPVPPRNEPTTPKDPHTVPEPEVGRKGGRYSDGSLSDGSFSDGSSSAGKLSDGSLSDGSLSGTEPADNVGVVQPAPTPVRRAPEEQAAQRSPGISPPGSRNDRGEQRGSRLGDGTRHQERPSGYQGTSEDPSKFNTFNARLSPDTWAFGSAGAVFGDPAGVADVLAAIGGGRAAGGYGPVADPFRGRFDPGRVAMSGANRGPDPEPVRGRRDSSAAGPSDRAGDGSMPRVGLGEHEPDPGQTASLNSGFVDPSSRSNTEPLVPQLDSSEGGLPSRIESADNGRESHRLPGISEFRATLCAILVAGPEGRDLHQVLATATRRRMLAALGELTPEQRNILQRLQSEQPVDQIARELDLSPDTVISSANRATTRIIAIANDPDERHRLDTRVQALAKANPSQLSNALRKLGREQKQVVLGLCRDRTTPPEIAEVLGYDDVSTIRLIAFGAAQRMAIEIAGPDASTATEPAQRTGTPSGSDELTDEWKGRTQRSHKEDRLRELERKTAAFAQIDGAIEPLTHVLRRLEELFPTPVRRVPTAESPRDRSLSDHEVELLCLMAKGRPDRAIAEIFNISEKTVKSRFARIEAALGTHGRAPTAVAAVRQGILDIPEPARPSETGELVGREIEVLRLMAAGLSRGDIAGRQRRSLSSVQRDVVHAAEKLGTEGRIPTILEALRLGILDPTTVEILALVADGKTNSEIAEELILTEVAVRSRLHRIGRRLGTGDRAGMVAIAIRSGILPADGSIAAPSGQLSAREVGVLSHVSDGKSNSEIAEELSLSASTVENHMYRIGRKLGTSQRAGMVAIALRAGILPMAQPAPATPDASETATVAQPDAEPGPAASVAEHRFVEWARARLVHEPARPGQSLTEYAEMYHLEMTQVNRWLAGAGLEASGFDAVPTMRFPSPGDSDSAIWLADVRGYLWVDPALMDELVDAPPGTWEAVERGSGELDIAHLRALLRRIPGAREEYLAAARYCPGLLTRRGEPFYPEGYRHVGQYIRFRREYEGLTRTVLVDSTGKSLETVRKWEIGATTPSKEAVQSVLEAVPLSRGVTVTYDELSETYLDLPRNLLLFPDPRTADSFGEYLRHFRRRNNLNRNQAAKIFGVEIKSVSSYEDGSARVSEVQLLKIVDRVVHLFDDAPCRSELWNNLAEAWGYDYRIGPNGETLPDPARYDSVNDWVLAARLYHRITRNALYERIGMSQSWLGGVEGGRSKPRVISLRKLRDSLDIPNDTLAAVLRRFYTYPAAVPGDAAEEQLFWHLIATRPGSEQEKEIKRRIFTGYVWVAEAVASRWARSFPRDQRDDLEQLAVEAILRAIPGFVPPGKFTPLAWTSAHYALMQAYYERMYPGDRRTRDQLIRVNTYINRRRDATGTRPDDAEIAQALDLDRAAIVELRRLLELRTRSKDAPVGDRPGSPTLDFADPDAQPVEEEADLTGSPFTDPEFLGRLREALSELPEPDLAEHVMVLHFLDGYAPDEVGERLRITPDAVGRLIAEVCERVREVFGGDLA